MPLVYHRVPDPPIASRIRAPAAGTGREPAAPYGLGARSRLAPWRSYEGVTPREHGPNRSDRVSRQTAGILRGPNPVCGLHLRHNRVSPFGAERGQDQLGVPGRRDGGRRPRRRPGRPDVVLVVRPGHRSVPAPPALTARGMALLLTGGRPAGPLPWPEAGMGTEEGLAEGAPPAPQNSGHRSPPRWKATPYPMRRAPAQDGCGEVG
jgi:hypothetical protein